MSNTPKTWDSISRKEAKEIFDAYVEAHPARLAEFFIELGRRNGPTKELDFSRNSLIALWGWFLDTFSPPETVATDEEMRASDPPWWYEFHEPLARPLGPEISRVLTLMAAYFAETIIKARPGSVWVLSAERNLVDYNQPGLQIEGRGRLLPDATLVTVGSQWRRGEPMGPELLATIFDIRVGPLPSSVERNEPTSAYEIGRGGRDHFDTTISFDDVVAHEEEERIRRLVSALARVPAIEQVVHEDREIVLLRAPSIDDETLALTVDRLWQALQTVNS